MKIEFCSYCFFVVFFKENWMKQTMRIKFKVKKRWMVGITILKTWQKQEINFVLLIKKKKYQQKINALMTMSSCRANASFKAKEHDSEREREMRWEMGREMKLPFGVCVFRVNEE